MKRSLNEINLLIDLSSLKIVRKNLTFALKINKTKAEQNCSAFLVFYCKIYFCVKFWIFIGRNKLLSGTVDFQPAFSLFYFSHFHYKGNKRDLIFSFLLNFPVLNGYIQNAFMIRIQFYVPVNDVVMRFPVFGNIQVSFPPINSGV